MRTTSLVEAGDMLRGENPTLSSNLAALIKGGEPSFYRKNA
jgi:hypothetical protein